MLFVFVNSPLFSINISCVQSSILKDDCMLIFQTGKQKIGQKYIAKHVLDSIKHQQFKRKSKDKEAYPSSTDGLPKDDLL